MLSYLRDPNNEGLPAEAEANKAHNGADKPGEQDFLTVASRAKSVRKGTRLLAALFIIGLITLALMIKKSEPQAAAGSETVPEEVQIETAIARITGIKTEMFNKMDEIVNKFYEFSDVMQVNVNELVKNPFHLELFLSHLNSNTDEEDTVQIDAEQIWRQQILQKGKKLELDSIMQSAKGYCCMINNKILYVGESIDSFKVIQIGEESVILDSDGIEIELKLAE